MRRIKSFISVAALSLVLLSTVFIGGGGFYGRGYYGGCGGCNNLGWGPRIIRPFYYPWVGNCGLPGMCNGINNGFGTGCGCF